MKVFSVTGLTGSGKTTVIECLIKELTKRGFTVGTVKEIHYDGFSIDTPGKNTYRHREAGAQTVTARGHRETDVLYRGKLPIYDILSHYKEDYIILEGVRDAVVPEIAVSREGAEPEITPLTFAVSGVFANSGGETYKDLPVINAVTESARLADLIIEKVPPLFYDIDPECCSKCGTDCRSLLSDVIKSNRSHTDCVLHSFGVSLKIDNKEIVIVPFVQSILKNVISGIVSQLKGYRKGAQIDISFKDE